MICKVEEMNTRHKLNINILHCYKIYFNLPEEKEVQSKMFSCLWSCVWVFQPRTSIWWGSPAWSRWSRWRGPRPGWWSWWCTPTGLIIRFSFVTIQVQYPRSKSESKVQRNWTFSDSILPLPCHHPPGTLIQIKIQFQNSIQDCDIVESNSSFACYRRTSCC